MTSTPGKRELARRRTNRDIRRAAMRLFLDRGFDDVTTSEVAEAAGVSPATLFNYFDTKEDLFFGQINELERALVAVVESCGPGESIMDALRAHVLWELTAGRVDTRPAAVAPFHREVARSTSLQAREHAMYDARELVLTEAIGRALGPDADTLRARVVARMYVAAEKLIASELRERLARVSPAEALRDIDAFVDDVFAILRAGLGELQSGATVPGAEPADRPSSA